MKLFDRYIGIDYSGAKAPVSRLPQLQVYSGDETGIMTAVKPTDAGARNWCRKELAAYVRGVLLHEERTIIGVDHGFSFSLDYFLRNKLSTWDEFLLHFSRFWPTERDHMYVEFVRGDREIPSGEATEYRLCELWTANAKSLFHFDVQGSPAKSTHAGLPWINALRRDPKVRKKTHFWPFDGFAIEKGKSVVAEAYPSLFRRRYHDSGRTADQQDAYVIAKWLSDMDRRGALSDCMNPPLTLPERQRAKIEGWILGVR